MNILNNIIITDINDVLVVHSEKGRHFQMINRPTYGLSLCMSGQITYSMNGKKYLSTPNTAILLPQGGSYSLQGDKEGLFPVINFRCESCSFDEIVVLELKNPHDCLQEFKVLKDLFFRTENRLRTYGTFYTLLSHVSSQNSNAYDSLAAVVKYIEEHISETSLSNTKLAEVMGISEVYLRKLFLSRKNTTPKQFVLNMRIQKAKQLLSDTPYTITSIAEECGFGSLYHFCRAFKEKTGFTPTEYANANKVYRI